jgi:hypothetical protein
MRLPRQPHGIPMEPEAWSGYIKGRPSDMRRLNVWMRRRPVMAAPGMLEGALTVAVVGTCLIHAWLAWTTRQDVRSVALGFAEVLPALRQAAELDPAGTLEEMAAHLEDTVQGILASMRVPTAQDHIGGAIATGFQMWMASKFGLTGQVGGEPGEPLLEAPSDGP